MSFLFGVLSIHFSGKGRTSGVGVYAFSRGVTENFPLTELRKQPSNTNRVYIYIYIGDYIGIMEKKMETTIMGLYKVLLMVCHNERFFFSPSTPRSSERSTFASKSPR